MWTGGSVPLGYDVEKKKIDIKKIELPYQKSFDSNCEDVTVIVANLEYCLRDNGQLDLKVLLKIYCDDINNLNLNHLSVLELWKVRIAFLKFKLLQKTSTTLSLLPLQKYHISPKTLSYPYHT